MPDARYTSPSGAPHSRSTSRSRRRSSSENSGPQRRRWPSPAHSDSGKDVLKTSLIFLGVVGAASVAASKYWPKGILYSDKESWAQAAKEEVKHIVRGDGSDNSEEHRRRPRGTHHDDHDIRHRPPSRVDIRDEIVVVRRPDGRIIYVDIGWVRSLDEGDSDRGRRRTINRPDARRFSDWPYRPQ